MYSGLYNSYGTVYYKLMNARTARKIAAAALILGSLALTGCSDTEAPASTDGPSISYLCGGMPSTLPCSLMAPPWNTSVQIIIVNP